MVERHAEGFGGDLGEDGVGPGAQIRGADVQVERAVVVHLDGRRGRIHARDARALHVDRHAKAMDPRSGPLSHAVLVAPADAFGADLDAARQLAAGDGLGHAFAALAKRLEHRGGAAGADVIASSQLQRVDSELLGERVDGHLERELALGRAVAAEGARHREVGVDDGAGVGEVPGGVVHRQRLRARVGDDGETVGSVGAGVGDGVEAEGVDGAVAVGADLHRHVHRVAGAAGDELLGTCVLDPRWPAGAKCHQSDQIVEEDLLFDAEASSDAGLDHPDAVHGEIEQSGDDAAGVEGHLGR